MPSATAGTSQLLQTAANGTDPVGAITRSKAGDTADIAFAITGMTAIKFTTTTNSAGLRAKLSLIQC
jgi:hypothetical protein